MVNVTVSVSDDLKAEMDKYPNVNWSEVTRKAFQTYIQNLKKSYPPLEVEIKGVRIGYDKALMKPLMILHLNITNKLGSKIVIDRMLFRVEFCKEYSRAQLQGAFQLESLKFHPISEETTVRVILYPDVNMLRRLRDKMNKTFWLYIVTEIYVQGFDSPEIKVPYIKIPIDEWKEQVEEALDSPNED